MGPQYRLCNRNVSNKPLQKCSTIRLFFSQFDSQADLSCERGCQKQASTSTAELEKIFRSFLTFLMQQVVTICSKVKTKKNPIAAVHSATGQLVQKQGQDKTSWTFSGLISLFSFNNKTWKCFFILFEPCPRRVLSSPRSLPVACVAYRQRRKFPRQNSSDRLTFAISTSQAKKQYILIRM